MAAPLKVFCCYAREDEEMLKSLMKHLTPLQRQGQIAIWSDTHINAGTEWEKELHQYLESADIILLLISPDFMNSDYCYSIEMRRAIERNNQGSARVIPILLRATFWHNAPFAKLQILPKDARPVRDKSWFDIDEAFNDVTERLNQIVSELHSRIQPVHATEKQASLAKEIPPSTTLPSQSTSQESVQIVSKPKDDIQRPLPGNRRSIINLLVLVLQAPIVAAILFFFAASGTFSPTNVVSCPQATYQATGIDRTVWTQGGGSDCRNVLNFLNKNTPKAQSLISQFGGSVNEALQHFIAPTSGTEAQIILFIMALAAIAFGYINGTCDRTINLSIASSSRRKATLFSVACFVQSLFLVIIVNWKTSFPQQGIILPAVVEIFISLFLTTLVGLTIGQMISALTPNNDRAISFIIILLIPQVFFSGAVFSLNNSVLQFLGAFCAVRWTRAVMGSTIGLHSQFVLPNGATIGESFSYQGTLFSTHTVSEATQHLLLCWSILLLMSLLFGRIRAYLLKRKSPKSS